MFPLFVVLVFGVLVFMQCNLFSLLNLYWSHLKDVFFNSTSVTSMVKNPNTVLLREAGGSGAEGLGASGPGVGSQGAGGLGAGGQ